MIAFIVLSLSLTNGLWVLQAQSSDDIFAAFQELKISNPTQTDADIVGLMLTGEGNLNNVPSPAAIFQALIENNIRVDDATRFVTWGIAKAIDDDDRVVAIILTFLQDAVVILNDLGLADSLSVLNDGLWQGICLADSDPQNGDLSLESLLVVEDILDIYRDAGVSEATIQSLSTGCPTTQQGTTPSGVGSAYLPNIFD